MKFSLNNFLMAVSLALDFVEIDIAKGITNHAKRVAYISLRVAKELEFSDEDLYDTVSLAILHDNGICESSSLTSSIKDQERKLKHCIIGERNVVNYPFIKKRENIIKYHHEAYDGSGFFGLKGNQIPIIAQIIFFADYLENNFNLGNMKKEDKIVVGNFVKEQSERLFSPDICCAFSKIINHTSFILDMQDVFIDSALNMYMPRFGTDLSLEGIMSMTDVFSKIIDSKSKFTIRHSKGIAEKASIMADYYGYTSEEKLKLIIAANLHDLGKLAIPSSILDNPNKLTEDEFYIVKSHTYYTRAALSRIDGFEDITEWASNHHEKLNGKGYPYGKTAEDLDFNSRLMGCIDIYQALTEERPYRKPLSHQEVINIMNNMVKDNYIDGRIVCNIDEVFKDI